MYKQRPKGKELSGEQGTFSLSSTSLVAVALFVMRLASKGTLQALFQKESQVVPGKRRLRPKLPRVP